jgi:hypothetical protein
VIASLYGGVDFGAKGVSERVGARFRIQIGDEVFYGELLEDKAPNICRAFRSQLPINSFSVHAKFAGRELIIMVPFFAEAENEILEVQPGDIAYYPGRQTICIFYGDTTPFGKVSVFARLIGPPAALRRAGDLVLERGWLPARLELATS